MQGSRILMTSEPKGIFLEGIVSGTPYPGTVMEIKPGVNPVGGGATSLGNGFTWQAYGTAGAATGDPRIWAVLTEDLLEGFSALATTAGVPSSQYVSGSRCFLYVPICGEFLNMCVAAEVGTGSANRYTIGERLTPYATTGQLVVESTSGTRAPFMSMEHLDVTADQVGWLWCMYTGM